MTKESSMDKAKAGITIFHVRNSNYAGGIETTLYGWFKYANLSRYNPRLFLFKERRDIHVRSMALLNEEGIECELLPWGQVRNLPGAVFKLWKEVRSAPQPILHSHDTRSDLVALIVAKLTKTPLIISNHAWHPADFKRKVLETIRVWIMHGADKIISVSKNTNEETLERGVPADKCIALYSGIDLEPYKKAPNRAQARKKYGLPDDCFVVGNIARLWPEKEQGKIIEAAKILHKKYPEMRFIIIGDGPLEEKLRSTVVDAGLEGIVLLPGFCEDFVAALAALDCFAFPSSAEGTPMVIYSAMAMGVSIVASPVSGVGEILESNVSALLMSEVNGEVLADAIERLYKDKDLCQLLGANAKKAVETCYSAEQSVKKLESIYTSMTQSGTVEKIS